MAYKVNPINFRLGINRIYRSVNNIYITNFSFLWIHYLKYEKFLFLFFYKYKFWIISSKILNIKSNLILIFCNFYRLRLYFNDKPIRKKKRSRFEPDGEARSYKWTDYFFNIFFKKKYINKIKNLFIRNSYNILWEAISNNLNIEKISSYVWKENDKYLKRVYYGITRNSRLPLRIDLFFFNNNNKKNLIVNSKVYKKIKKKKKLKLKLKKKNYFIKQKYFNLIFNNSKWGVWEENSKILVDNIRHKYSISSLSDNSEIFFKEWYICEKIFFFHLSTILKIYYFKKNIILKLRDIHNLKEFKPYSWEDALRTCYIQQQKKKHFIRTLFRDFVHLHRIAYLQMDACLFVKIIKNLFEMTKFHKRLIYLLKSLIITLSLYYLHINCKVQLKGKMQYKRRTKTIILFKQSMPLNQLNKIIEYSKNHAITPFGIIGIKTWLYFI